MLQPSQHRTVTLAQGQGQNGLRSFHIKNLGIKGHKVSSLLSSANAQSDSKLIHMEGTFKHIKAI